MKSTVLTRSARVANSAPGPALAAASSWMTIGPDHPDMPEARRAFRAREPSEAMNRWLKIRSGPEKDASQRTTFDS